MKRLITEAEQAFGNERCLPAVLGWEGEGGDVARGCQRDARARESDTG